MAKFAPITADLLARKGEARPWAHNPAVINTFPPKDLAPEDLAPEDLAPVSAPLPWSGIAPAARLPDSHCGGPAGSRKLTLRVSETDYECLAILAAKRDISRQTLLRELLNRYLSEAAKAHRASCGCIGTSCRR